MNISFFVYILESTQHSRFYIGQTKDMSDRLYRHNTGLVRSTKPYLPWILVGFIEKSSRSEAIILERKLKNLNREDMKNLSLNISLNNPMIK